MFAVLRFLFFNVALSSTDVGTDFFTFLELLVDNPRWACLTLLWTIMPFLVHTAFFVYKKATGKCEACANWTELMKEFYKEAGSHLPFVSSLHNIWRARRLHQLNFGTAKFEMKDHKQVEEILDEAGRCSEGESNYEAGPQSVTQVTFVANIARGTTDPGYCLFNLSYLSSLKLALVPILITTWRNLHRTRPTSSGTGLHKSLYPTIRDMST